MKGYVGYGYTGTCAHGDDMIVDTIERYYAPELIGKDPFMVRNYGIRCASAKCTGLAARALPTWRSQQSILRFGTSWRKPRTSRCGSILAGKVKGIKAYNTNGGWLNWPKERLLKDVTDIVEQGFTGVKIKVGKADPREDYERVKAVRQAIGDDTIFMIDVNQQWNINTAMTWGKKLEEFDLFWLEEPLNPDDIMGHKKLADELNVPIALGEHVYNKYAFRDYIHQGAIEYCQVDVTRVAGITEWLQVAGLAAAYDVPICPHVGDMGQIHQHLGRSDAGRDHAGVYPLDPPYLRRAGYGRERLLCAAGNAGRVHGYPSEILRRYRVR